MKSLRPVEAQGLSSVSRTPQNILKKTEAKALLYAS